jgi:hypothetical protein
MVSVPRLLNRFYDLMQQMVRGLQTEPNESYLSSLM